MQECSLMRILQASQPPALFSSDRSAINIVFHIKLRDVMSISPESSSFYFPLVFYVDWEDQAFSEFTLHFFFGKQLCQLCLLWKGRLDRKQFLLSTVRLSQFTFSLSRVAQVCRVQISASSSVLLLSIERGVFSGYSM